MLSIMVREDTFQKIMEESRKTILVVGANPAWQKTVSCTRLAPGEVVRVKVEASGAAGKGFNTARAIRAFGFPVSLVSAAGPDAPEWEEACREEGMSVALFRICDRIRTATSVLDLTSRETTEIVEEGPEVADGAALVVENLVRQVSANASIVVVAGTFPPGLAPRGVLEILCDATSRVVVDSVPSIRTLRDMDRAPARLLLKLNESEWKVVFGEPTLTSALKQARGLWPRAELVATRGDKGAVLWEGAGECRSLSSDPFEPAVAVHPIGAGDAFTGGLVVRLAQDASVLDAALHGMAVARASCLSPLPARFSMEEVAVSSESVRSEIVHV